MITREQIEDLELAGYHTEIQLNECLEDEGYLPHLNGKVIGEITRTKWIDAWADCWHHYQHNLTPSEVEKLKEHYKDVYKVSNSDKWVVRSTIMRGISLSAAGLFDTPRLAYQHFLTTIQDAKV